MANLPDWLLATATPSKSTNLPDWLTAMATPTTDPVPTERERMETERADGQATIEDRIFSFIEKKEAGPAGFDSYYGIGHGGPRVPVAPYAIRDGVKVNLKPTQMTLDEIREWQWNENPPGPGTTAIGMFQIVDQSNAPTMSGLRRKLGLTGKELFTPDLQRRMATELLKEKGLDKFKAGTMDPVTFARGVAQVWAGLPVLAKTNRGKVTIHPGNSYYQGDGINKAQFKPSEFAEYRSIFEPEALVAELNGDK